MKVKSIHDVPKEQAKEIMGILMENKLYLELPIQERSILIKYIFDLYISKKSTL
jgi:CxxC motif-containing protein